MAWNKKNARIMAAIGLLSALAAVLHAGFPLWLSPPTRCNPNDPKAPNFSVAFVVPTRTQTQHVTPGTATPSETFGPTGTATPSPSETPSATSGPLGTATVSSTPTPSASVTPAAKTDLFSDFELPNGDSEWGTQWFSYSDRCYDPPTCNAGWGPCSTTTTSTSFPANTTIPPVDVNGDTITPGHAAHFVGVLGDGPSGCGAGNYSYAVIECFLNESSTLVNGVAVNFPSSLPQISEYGIGLYMKLGPTAQAGQDYELVLTKAGITQAGAQYYFNIPASSLSKTSWTYIQAPFPVVGTAVAQPASTFAQPSWATPVNWSMTDLVAIQLEPVTYDTPYDVYADDISFINPPAGLTPTVTSTVTPTPANPDLFSDFEDANGASEWGPVWFTYSDRCYDPPTCNAGWGPCSTTTTSIAFPSSTSIPPVDVGGDTLTSGHAAHFSGVLGDGPTGCGSGNYSYAVAQCYFNVNSTIAVPVAVNFTTTMPTVGEHGLSFYMKLGPTSQTGQDYEVVLVKAAITQSGAQYYFNIPASSLSNSAWTFIQAPFPTAGTAAAQPASTFAQPNWANPVNWDMTDLQAIEVEPLSYDTPFDVYVDDIYFY